ncbi:hypothetical protein BDN71DRAFT_1511121 [Pleurotus eryngii]|uniref:Uncharacterized protein n=1 Tax=Pleurotus eryngii TaxID=5323 RepID=A0A9P5ZLU5_PLEER|nr:hypothetical protein BDN71DRAFT_1511121 [Pleurotus eryngii]
MDLASSPAAAALIITVQEPTPHGNTALANLSHALAQLQVPPPRMTRAQSATLTDTLRQSTHSTSRTPVPDDSKAAKRKAVAFGFTSFILTSLLVGTTPIPCPRIHDANTTSHLH